ncbi:MULTISPECIES: hypothetical protein [unclassified Streptomyces]|jgi:hypothetical protein|uniref:hypothetical protein n=1 Tax=Streptomyces sp. ZSW22 TaxID=3055050 RepID=UPI0015CC12A1|nr:MULTISPECIES: hypothetical protein [unclassified Streptomyces]MDN3250870.1 hypothetical protein [Streptomyces sp. ZSW22]
MSWDRGPRGPRRFGRQALIAASATALSLTASGCVVVHGEREVLPSATRAEAAKALEQFTSAYNAADKAYDTSLDADHTTGALAAIDSARLKAGRANHPDGNPSHTPLELTDAEFTIPKKAGWPRWFVADAKGNKGGDTRWLLVFTRHGMEETWQAAYLTLVAPGKVPEFKTDADGWAEAVPANATDVAAPPGDLSKDYTAYLKDGGQTFADGAHTSAWRELRQKRSKRPGLVTQYIDEPLANGDYAPLALRTKDGGAAVFFSTRHYEKQTAAQGVSVPTPNEDVLALTDGEIKQSLTMEFVSNQIALDPADGPVSVLGRVQGLTSAKGE